MNIIKFKNSSNNSDDLPLFFSIKICFATYHLNLNLSMDFKGFISALSIQNRFGQSKSDYSCGRYREQNAPAYPYATQGINAGCG